MQTSPPPKNDSLKNLGGHDVMVESMVAEEASGRANQDELKSIDEVLASTAGDTAYFGLSRYQLRVIALLAPNYATFTVFTMLPIFLMPKLQAWEMDKVTIALLGSLFFAGHFSGVILGGVYADKFGRRRGLLVALCLATFAGPATFISMSPLALGIIRFLSGMAAGAIINTAVVLMLEFAAADQRAVSKTCLTLSGWSIPLLMLTLLAYLTRNMPWQWLALCTAQLPLLLALAACTIPESPRYMLGRSDEATALALLNRVANVNCGGTLEQVLADTLAPTRSHSSLVTRA